MGNSKNGETLKFDGPYFVMEALLRFPKWLPLPYIGEGKTHVNTDPESKTVCDAIYVCQNSILDIGWGLPEIYEYAPNIVNFFVKNRKKIKTGPFKPDGK